MYKLFEHEIWIRIKKCLNIRQEMMFGKIDYFVAVTILVL